MSALRGLFTTAGQGVDAGRIAASAHGSATTVAHALARRYAVPPSLTRARADTAMSDILGNRGRSLEEQFFAERDHKLMEKMRGELHALEERKKLTHVSGIVEEKVLKDLMSVGIRAEALTAVGMIPMIEVAWSDGAVTADERSRILKIAEENGIASGTTPYALLQKWLETRPSAKVFQSWREYVTELAKVTPKDTFGKLRDLALERCKAVAMASGGFMGIGSKISRAEQAKLDEIQRALGA
jgi:hypothetical protein